MSVGIVVVGFLEEVVWGEVDVDFVSFNRFDYGRDNFECEVIFVFNRFIVLIGVGVDVVV